MKKSVYSIVLMDDVVQAIDELAMRKGTSRSNLINQILAEQVRCITPEKRMQSIFSFVEQQMQDAFRIQMQASDVMLSLQSTLRYKYRPTLRYSVELMKAPTEWQLGWLRISCRTQNQALLSAMGDFFYIWQKLEREYDEYCRHFEGLYEVENGRLTRTLLKRQESMDPQDIGEAISRYVNRFNSLIQTYMGNLQSQIPVNLLEERLSQQFNKELLNQHPYDI